MCCPRRESFYSIGLGCMYGIYCILLAVFMYSYFHKFITASPHHGHDLLSTLYKSEYTDSIIIRSIVSLYTRFIVINLYI